MARAGCAGRRGGLRGRCFRRAVIALRRAWGGATLRDVGVRTWIEGWPVYRQLTGTDPLGRGAAAQSPRSRALTAAHRDRRLGGPLGLPVLRGRLRPAGLRQGRRRSPRSRATRTARSPAAGCARRARRARAWSPATARQTKVRYRRPYGTDWEDLDLDTAMDMIADRVLAARRADLGGRRRRGPAAEPDAGHLQPRRGDAGQRGELPHQEAVHRDGRDPDREPGPHLTLRHRPRSGDQLRSWRRDGLPAGPGQL